MALFGKKMSLDEILKAIANLSEEEKAKVKAMIDGGEEEKEEPVEQEETGEVEQVESEQVEEQPEEVAEDSVEEPVEEPIEGSEEQPEIPQEPVENAPATEELNGVEQDNSNEVMQGALDRISALEEQIAQLNELKELMEKYTQKQSDSLGYKGAIPGAKKDIHDMSASELKEKMLNGEI